MIGLETPPASGSTSRRGSPQPPLPLQLEQFQAQLEAGYEFHTEQLARLSTAGRKGRKQSADHALSAAASRQALIDIAAALRDMAEGRYGSCAGCDDAIPAEFLEQRPETRYCLLCRKPPALPA